MTETKLICTEKGCGEDIDLEKSIELNTNCWSGIEFAHPCKNKNCQCLYWEDGKPVFDTTGQYKAFLSEDGKVIGKKIKMGG